jgi:ParB-like chromosome segregation protein Spo0J
MRRFQWTPAREEAFLLARTGRYTQAEIAQRLGVTRRTVEGWIRRPAWRARVYAQVEADFAEMQRQIQEQARARRAALEASYTPPTPRGARSHQAYRARYG